jgi:hypothetical protein
VTWALADAPGGRDELREFVDSPALDVGPDRVSYTPLGELTTATEKARRDALRIPFCEV